MDSKTDTALRRLESILPLHSGLQSLGSEDAALYCRLLDSYVQRGRTLSRDEVAGLVGDAEATLNRLVDSRLIVLDADGNTAGAYPFTSQQREHRVHINGVMVHCMCALDALAVSPMFGLPAVIESVCRVTGQAIHLEQNGTSLDGTLNACFGIDWGAAAGDVVCAESLCLEMMFLADTDVAGRWRAGSPQTRETFDLPAAVEFAAAFFVPLHEHCRQ